MTEFQKDCITALLESPTAFQLFKAKVRDRKMLDQFLSRLFPYERKIIKKKEGQQGKAKHTVLNRMNIGIEIEYEGDKTSDETAAKLKKLGVVMFNSGWDGFGYDSEPSGWMKTEMLHENRIRLDGINGLSALYCLLEDMKETRCAFGHNSSIHIHTDCAYDKSFNPIIKPFCYYPDGWERQNANIIFREYANILFNNGASVHFCPALNTIFKLDLNTFFDNTNINFEFKTIEYRAIVPTFNYSLLLIQIIAVVHLTRCIKNKCAVNNELLNFLSCCIPKIDNITIY